MNALRKQKALRLTESMTDLVEAVELLEKEQFTNEEISEVIGELKEKMSAELKEKLGGNAGANANATGSGADTVAPVAPKPAGAINRGAIAPASPNDALRAELAQITYKDAKGQFRGEDFKRYAELVGDRSFIEIDEEGNEKPVHGRLMLDAMYDFQLFRVKPIRKTRYVGVKDSPMDYVGLEITNDTPIHTSRMSVRSALEFNAQIMNQHSIAGYGKYYLLKK